MLAETADLAAAALVERELHHRRGKLLRIVH
jgi:hypothetical protein